MSAHLHSLVVHFGRVAVLASFALFASCAGENGVAGPSGPPGVQGPDGTQGETGQSGQNGQNGQQGLPGSSCTVVDNGDGTRTITCDDGTEVDITDGTTCTVTDNGDGTKTIACSDGTSVIVTDGGGVLAPFSLLVEVPDQLEVLIDSVTIASPPVVEFRVRDVPAHRGAVGLTMSQLRFGIAKLIPGANAQSPNVWQSYINSKGVACTPGVGTPPCPNVGQSGGEEETQATTESNGALIDNGDGSYTYTFARDVATQVDPVTSAPITYDASLTHRVAIQMSGAVNGIALPAANGIHTFVPNGSPVTTTRDIVDISSCNECHGALALHGGGRVDTQYCVVCHNPGTTDPETGNSVDMPYMVHAIHGAAKREEEVLPPYEIVGYGRSLHDYSEVTYPQALNNCKKCHSATDTATPDGDGWQERPYRAACAGCHNLATAVPDHSSATDAQCAGCHSEGGFAGPIAESHHTEDATPNSPSTPAGAFNFTYEIASVTMDSDGDGDVDGNDDGLHPTIRFRILRDGVAMTDLSAPALTALQLTGGPSFLFAYALPQDGITEPTDFNNAGRAAYQPQSLSVANIIADAGGTTTFLLSAPDSNGFFSATLEGTNQFPAGATLRTVALQGYYTQANFFGAGQNLARHAISVEKTVTGDTDRRSIVDSAKCANCHEWFLGHGGNRVYATDVCIMCHVPNLTSSGRGAAAGTLAARLATAGADTAHMTAQGYDITNALTFPEEPMGFKNLIHSTHAAAKRESNFDFVRDRGASGVFYYDFEEITFPGVLNNCETCHKPGTYDVDLPDGVMVSTHQIPGVFDDTAGSGNICEPSSSVAETTADVVRARSATCVSDAVARDAHIVSTPIAGTCVGCHDTPIAELHMEDHGGFVLETVGDISASPRIETCVLCHGPGKLADVAVIHK